MPAPAQPSLFALMARLTAEARQKLGERRRALKLRPGTEERLVASGVGKWKLEYWQSDQKVEEISFE